MLQIGRADDSKIVEMALKHYLLSLPERLVRSVLGLGAGVAREVGEVALPDAVRGSRLYQNLVDTTLRFLIEDHGHARVRRGKHRCGRVNPSRSDAVGC